jgi:ABC-2 type transport system ATP-binding protein
MIQIKALDYAYQKKNPLFKNLALSLKPGSICGLLGKNGAGKTTLLKLIAGLLYPKAGSVRVMQHLPEARRVEFLQNLYLLPDTFSLPKMSMKQFLNCYAGFYPKFNQASYQNALDAFELDDTKKLTILSHGQQKKFLLAFGFATGANLMLLDEPTNALDIPSKQQFRKLLATHVSPERTFVISTHQVKDIEHMIDSVVILDNGKVVFNQSYDAANDLENLFNQVVKGDMT